MDLAAIGSTPYPFKGEGNAVVDKPRFEDGKVWINTTQYFDNAPSALVDLLHRRLPARPEMAEKTAKAAPSNSMT